MSTKKSKFEISSIRVVVARSNGDLTYMSPEQYEFNMIKMSDALAEAIKVGVWQVNMEIFIMGEPRPDSFPSEIGSEFAMEINLNSNPENPHKAVLLKYYPKDSSVPKSWVFKYGYRGDRTFFGDLDMTDRNNGSSSEEFLKTLTTVRTITPRLDAALDMVFSNFPAAHALFTEVLANAEDDIREEILARGDSGKQVRTALADMLLSKLK